MSSQPQADVKPGCDLQVPQMSEKVWTHTMHQTSEVEFPLMPVNPNVKFYICDRCGKRVELLQENLLQIAAGNRMLLRRWKADENVQWFCTPCLATTEGCGIGEVGASRNLNLPLHPVQNNFLQLQKEGTLAGYDFIGWLKKTGELVKDACPQNRHTPIYWKMPETGKWFSFSSAALREAVVKDAILSVDDWKRLVQKFSPKWHFLGFIHDASGKCIVDVPPPTCTGKTKVRLHTEHGLSDVFACLLKDTMTKGCDALPLKCKISRFLQLQKNGKLAGYKFIGWLNKTGELVKDACPQSPRTPIYWKMPQTGKWFYFSQTALRGTKALVKNAILSLDEWKRLVQNFSPRWHFLGFIHDASGNCIVEVPPPINESKGLCTGQTKVRLQTDHGQFDVFACLLKDILTKECGALPLERKMRLVPRPSLGLLQAMQNSKSRGSDQAKVIYCWQVQAGAPSVVNDCLKAWEDGVALAMYGRRLMDRHASCADKNPYIWFCPPPPGEVEGTDWNSPVRHQNVSHTECWLDTFNGKRRKLSMQHVTHNRLPLMNYTIDDVKSWLTEFPIVLQLKSSSTTFSDYCRVELQDELLQQTHSMSIKDLKRLRDYHQLASDIEEHDLICNYFYIGTLLTHDDDPSKLDDMLRFFKNCSTDKLHSHSSPHDHTALPFEIADFMHTPDNLTDPSGNWLIMFNSGKLMVRQRKSYANCKELYRQFLRLKQELS